MCGLTLSLYIKVKEKSQFDLRSKDTTPKNSAVAHLFLQCTGSVMEMDILTVKPVKQNN